jgi:hypothetical protein
MIRLQLSAKDEIDAMTLQVLGHILKYCCRADPGLLAHLCPVPPGQFDLALVQQDVLRITAERTEAVGQKLGRLSSRHLMLRNVSRMVCEWLQWRIHSTSCRTPSGRTCLQRSASSLQRLRSRSGRALQRRVCDWRRASDARPRHD